MLLPSSTKNMEGIRCDAADPVVGRFSEDLIDLLLQVKWWDFAPEKLVGILPLLCSSDLEQVKKRLQDIVATL